MVKAPFAFLPALLACAAGCENEPPPASRAIAPPAATSAMAVSSAPKPKREIRVHSAYRCGECHEKMYDEWLHSAHAHSTTSALYRAMSREREAQGCERCHSPLAELLDPKALPLQDGVSCEICHRIEEVRPSARGAGFRLRFEDDIKFGPVCDAVVPYFHEADCKPFFTTSEVCAGCHWLRLPSRRGSLPVHTEYEEWKAGPESDKSCQSCHMPGVSAALAVGEKPRKNVPDHGFFGHDEKLRGSSVKVSANVERRDGRLEVQARVTNARAGHPLPVGGAGRQLVLRLRALSEAGAPLAQDERVFERRLVDDRKNVVPFYRATQAGSDTRLLPGETRVETFELSAEGAHSLHVELARRNVAPEIAKLLGVAPEETQVLKATLKLDARHAQAPLTRRVVLKR